MKRASLNHTYRLVWNNLSQTFVAVAEHVKSHGKRSRSGPSAVAAAVAAVIGLVSGAALAAPPTPNAPAATALPTGGQITAGSGAIATSGNTLTVNQNTDKLVANWSTFNIGRDATVQFNQPSSTSQALNRISDQNASQIFGQLKANGQVYLLNPNGIVFGAGSQVNVGGLVASTLKLSDADFMAGQLRFTEGNGAGGITNQGNLNGKVVALIAPQVSNQGSISATGGTAVLAAGDVVSLDFTGDGLLKVNIERGTYNALVENKALIEADGGQVLMSARTADALLATVINNTGTIRAQTLANQAGRIVLIGDMDNGVGEFGGSLDASAPNGGDGGFIETSAAKVQLKDDLKVTTDAATGKTGEWLIDPTDFTIAATGGDMTGAQVATALLSNNVTIQTGAGTNSININSQQDDRYGASGANGDIFVKDSIITTGDLNPNLQEGGRTLTLKAHRNIVFDLVKTNPLLDNIYDIEQGKIDATAGGNKSRLNLIISANFSGTGGAVRFEKANGNLQMGNKQVNIKTNGGELWIGGGSSIDPSSGKGTGYAQGLSNDPKFSSGIYLTNVNIDTTRINIGNGGINTVYAGAITMKGKSATNSTATDDGQNIVAGIMSDWRQVLTINSGDARIILDGIAVNNDPGKGISSYGISLNGGSIKASSNISLKGDAKGVVSAKDSAGVSIKGFKTSGEQIINSTPGRTDMGTISIAGYGGKNATGSNSGLILGSADATNSLPVFVTTNSAGTKNGSSINVEVSTEKTGDYAMRMESNATISTLLLDKDQGSAAQKDSLITRDIGALSITSKGGSVYARGTLINNGEVEFWKTQGVDGSLKLWGIPFNTTDAEMAGNRFYTANTTNNLRGTISVNGFTDVDIRNDSFTWNGNEDMDYAYIPTKITGIDATGVIRVAIIDSDLQLLGLVKTSTTATDAITLNTWYNFNNQAGVNGVQATGGGTARWLVYSKNPATNTFGPGATSTYLKSNNQAVWKKDVTDFDAAASAGNRYIFQVPGTLEFFGTAPTINIEYGNTAGAAPATLDVYNNTTKTVSSNAEHTQYGSVFNAAYTGSPDFSGGTGSLLNVGLNQPTTLSKGTTVLQDNVTATYLGTTTVNVTPRPLTLALADQTKPFDGTSTATLKSTDFTLSGLVLGESFTISKTSGDYVYADGPNAVNTPNAAKATNVAVFGLISNDFTAGLNTLASNYTFPNAAFGKGTITPLTLIASIIGAPTKEYDRSTSITTLSSSNYQLVGLATPGAITINKTTGDFNFKDVATANLITTTLQSTDFTVAIGTLLSNYAFPTTASGAGSISKKTLTVTGISTNNKPYDGTTATTVSAAGANFTGLLGNDDVTVGTTANFADKNAGTGKSIIMTLGGTDAGNYQGTATATANILPIALTISGITATPKVYDASTTATTISTTGAVYTGLIGSDAVGLAATGSFADKNVGTGKTITLSSNYTGADAGNYTITSQASTTGNITHKALTISGISATPKEYDGNTSATLNTAGAVYGGLIGSDAVTLSATGTYANKNVGTGKAVTLASSYSGADTGNYTITDQTSATGNITAKALTITGITADNKVYNKSTTATVSTTNAQFGGKIVGDDVTVSATGSFADANVADGITVTLNSTSGGADAGNYTITNQLSAVANITPKPLTITGVTVNPKTYDGTTKATVNTSDAAYGGIESGDTVNVSFAGGGEFATKDAGVGKAVTLLGTISGASASNYSLSGSLTADIARLALTVSGITASNKDYDGTSNATVSTTNAQLVGKISGDIVTVAATGRFADVNAADGITVNLGRNLEGADSKNYTFSDDSQSSTTANITPKALTITGSTAASRDYDGGTTASITAGTLSGFAPGESLTTTAIGTFDSKNAGERTATAVYSLLGGAGGGLASNYSLANTTHTATLAPIALSISGITSNGKVYDGNPTASVNTGSAVYDGLLNGDAVSVAATGTFANKNAGVGKTVTLASTYSGADTGNYTITDQTSTATGYDITAKTLTISGITAAKKMFDGNDTATLSTSAAQFTGLVTGDAVQLAATGKFSDINPGNGKTVNITSSYTGADAGNYSITDQATASADITAQSSDAVSALTSPQSGITGTATTTTGSSSVANTVLPGTGTATLTQISTQVLVAVAPVAAPSVVVMPSQGTMTLSHSAGSNAVRLVASGATTTLSMGPTGVAPDLPSNSNPAIPVFKVNANKPISETALAVRFNQTSISGTTVAASDSGLTSSAAINSAGAATGMKTTTTTLTLQNGSSATMTVGLTAEGVLVVSVPDQTGDVDNSKALSLVAMSAAKDALGISPDAIKGVLIQSDSKP